MPAEPSNSVTLAEPVRAWMHLRVTDPLVAWLTYRGLLESIDSAAPGSMSIWAASASRASTKPGSRPFYEREHRLEIARRKENPEAVSRLTGLFVFPTRDYADRAVVEWDGFEDYFLSEVEILPGSRVSTYDADWITVAGASMPDGAASTYSRGLTRTSSPHLEYLVSGRVVVLGTELRTKARDVVEAYWPEAVALLEIARLGAELGSSIGYIAAHPFVVGPEVQIRHILDMRDAENNDFLRALTTHVASLPPEHINRRDLAVGGERFRVPDLSRRDIHIPLDQWPW